MDILRCKPFRNSQDCFTYKKLNMLRMAVIIPHFYFLFYLCIKPSSHLPQIYLIFYLFFLYFTFILYYLTPLFKQNACHEIFCICLIPFYVHILVILCTVGEYNGNIIDVKCRKMLTFCFELCSIMWMIFLDFLEKLFPLSIKLLTCFNCL